MLGLKRLLLGAFLAVEGAEAFVVEVVAFDVVGEFALSETETGIVLTHLLVVVEVVAVGSRL